MSSSQITPAAAELLRDPHQLAARLQSSRAAAGAEEFEASLFATVLDKMEKNLTLTEDDNSDPGREGWCALGVRAVSQALAHSHVLGVAHMLQHSLGVGSTAGDSATGTAATGTAGKEI